MDNELEGVLSYLSSQPYHASREWVEGCVNFFREDRAERRYSVQDLRKFVVQQWELADLREISPGCLPSNLSLQKKVVLPGRYSLQVETMHDISQSFYSQLQKIRNVNLENITATDIKKSESWEPKPTQMLHLMLCDGVQVVKAIEYRPIISLKRNIIPGFKIIIIGPVDCRRGVILLQEKNLKLIGGEVDSLLIPNALENVLARALNTEENPDPYKLQSESRDHSTTSLPHASVQRSEESSTVDQFPDDDDDFALVADSVVANMENNKFHTTSKNFNSLDEDELAYQREVSLMGIDFDDIDYLEQQNISDIRKLVDNKFVKPSEPIRKQTNNSNSDMDLLDADDNDAIFMNVLSNDFDLKNNASTSKCQSNNLKRKLGEGNISSNKIVSLKHDEIEYKKSCTANDNDVIFMNVLSNDFHFKNKASTSKCQSNNLKRKLGEGNISSNKIVSLKHDEIEYKNITNINSNHNLKNETDNTNMKISKTSLNHKNSSLQKEYLFNKSDSLGRENKSSKIITKEVPSLSNSSLRNSSTLEDEFSPVLCNFSKHTLDADRIIESNSNNLNADESDMEKDVQTIITNELPFIYLCQIEKFVNILEVCTVKAFVVTLTSLLSMKPNGWHLTAKISDGSAIMEVLFSSTVLEDVIGYSRNEIIALKRDVSKNPLIKEMIKKALESAQQHLINLNALLHINFESSQDIPIIVGVTNITESHWKKLKERVNSVD